MNQVKSILGSGIIALICLGIEPLAGLAQSKDTTIAPQMTALTTLNDKFRQFYLEAKAAVQNPQETPVIICYGDHMQLIFGDKRDQVSFITSSYTALKIIDHIPLAIFCLLQDNCDKPLSEQAKSHLKELKELIVKARPELSNLNYPAATMARQTILVDSSLKFIDTALEASQVSTMSLDHFVDGLRPEILENAYEAVSTQLTIQDEKVSLWKKELGPNWANLKVVIVSGHMPREQHSSFQYFAKILGVKKEGDKIVYSEGPADEKDALNLLHTHMLDKKVGQSFFNDRWRMHRDFLSDGAARYLRSHKLAAQSK